MALRASYPYEDDQGVILEFLRGKSDSLHHTDDNTTLRLIKGVLHLGDADPIAHFTPDGTLQGIAPRGSADAHMKLRVVNFMMRELLLDEDQMVVEQNSGEEQTWRFADRELTPGLPFEVVGPMSMLAYRASKGVRTKRGPK
jgi:hypothetical protein